MINGRVKKTDQRRAVSVFEVMIAAGVLALVMLVAYRLFFAEVRAIRTVLQHAGVNESSRRFFVNFGNDARSANWLEYPVQIDRAVVGSLEPISEGVVCVFIRQRLDLTLRPPDRNLVRQKRVEYVLKPTERGTSALYRKVETDFSGETKRYQARVSDGIKEMLVFSSRRRPVTMADFSSSLPFKSAITHEPYDLDGHGPYLVHVRASFAREGASEGAVPHTINTSFALRGRLSGVHP